MNISILGKGAWGLAIGELLQDGGHSVEWLDKEGHQFSNRTEMVVIALPTQVVREVLQNVPMKAPQTPVVSLSKGIDIATGQRISQIVAAHWPEAPMVALSGPSLAGELRQKVPTAMVAASLSDKWSGLVQGIFHGPFLRVYRSRDLAGVEWGGALKNIYALAAGLCAGLGLGENSLAGLVTRSLREMTRIAVHFGAQGRPSMVSVEWEIWFSPPTAVPVGIGALANGSGQGIRSRKLCARWTVFARGYPLLRHSIPSFNPRRLTPRSPRSFIRFFSRESHPRRLCFRCFPGIPKKKGSRPESEFDLSPSKGNDVRS